MEKNKVSTPGRVCLFGEHQDYLKLPIIASAISLRISIEGEERIDKNIVINLPDLNEIESFELTDDIKYVKERDYFRSVVNVLRKKGFTFSRGVECKVTGEIPINAGTSSSSALVVSWVNFLTKFSDQALQLPAKDIALLAYEAEVLEFGEPGGMMDQYSTSLGGIIFLNPYPNVELETLTPKLKTFVLGNSEEPKNTKQILSRVKDGVLNIVKHLKTIHNEFSLQTVLYKDLAKYKSELTEDQYMLLEGTVINRDITASAYRLLQQQSLNHKEIGDLLNRHQSILRDVLKISTPKIDKMIQAALDAGAYGAKINGSGGGGCMFAYAPENTNEVFEAVNKIGKAYIVNVAEGSKQEILKTIKADLK